LAGTLQWGQRAMYYTGCTLAQAGEHDETFSCTSYKSTTRAGLTARTYATGPIHYQLLTHSREREFICHKIQKKHTKS